jgi:hypothetical protein
MPLRYLICALVCFGSLIAIAPGAAGSPVEDPPPPVATPSGFVCPSKPNSDDIQLWIHVNKWCILPGVRKQAQVKIQMKIHNRSDRHRLDLSQDKIRLVVHQFNRNRWTPARVGSRTLDRPVRTTYRGETVWAIPANADGAFDPLPNQPKVGTFATHWGISSLGPGQTLVPRYHFGDLVFYMPVPKKGKVKANIVGIAFVKGRDIIALCTPDVWGEHAPAASFRAGA